MSRDAQDQDWTEIAAGCWVRGYSEWNVNVGVVAGDEGLLVVDTRGTADQGRQLRDDIRRLDTRPVRWVVNTHQHFDHAFGNIAFDDARIHAHENAAAALADSERAPDTTFSSAAALDLGDRFVEMFYPGRGHTDGDVVIRVPDLDVIFAGDLIEESAPPSFGEDSYPLDWPETLELLVGVIGEHSAVVPGHGAPVGQTFVRDQRADIGAVAATITGLAESGVPVDEALAQGDWPWEPALLVDAVRRGYAQLGPPRRGLPIIS